MSRKFVFCTLIFLSAIGNAFEIKRLRESPRIDLIVDFLTPKECDAIIEKATPKLTRSTVLSTNPNGAIDDRRTSYGMFFPTFSSDPILSLIERNISEITGIPIENGEGLQVLHYQKGGEYQPHYDYFEKTTPGGLRSLERGGQRVATCIMYLNTPEKGGETIFPKAKLRIIPKKGNAVLFYNVTPDGEDDPMSFHGGAPVLEGEKWIMTKWLRAGIFY